MLAGIVIKENKMLHPDDISPDYNAKCQQAYDLVYDYFKGDKAKTAMWFEVPNPALGGISGKQMIRNGRVDKLLKFIESAIAGNNP